jgi:hypothetical protein
MNPCSAVPDPNSEQINARSLDLANPKLFFKPIGGYGATSHIIHVRVPFNFEKVFNAS